MLTRWGWLAVVCFGNQKKHPLTASLTKYPPLFRACYNQAVPDFGESRGNPCRGTSAVCSASSCGAGRSDASSNAASGCRPAGAVERLLGQCLRCYLKKPTGSDGCVEPVLENVLLFIWYSERGSLIYLPKYALLSCCMSGESFMTVGFTCSLADGKKLFCLLNLKEKC